jgi:hypothetical protein
LFPYFSDSSDCYYIYNGKDRINYSNCSIEAVLANNGWGPAKNLEWRSSINLGQNADKLRIIRNQFDWNTDVDPGKFLNHVFFFNLQDGFYLSFYKSNCSDLYQDYGHPIELIDTGYIYTDIKYSDQFGKEYSSNFYKDIYLYKIYRSEGCVHHREIANLEYENINRILASQIHPLEILYVDSIDPERTCPYIYHFNLNHYIGKDQVDRVIININSTKKSGKFKSRIKAIYNSNITAVSETVNLDLVKSNY